MQFYLIDYVFIEVDTVVDAIVAGTVACSATSIKVVPVTDDESCEIKVNGSKPGTVTTLNVGATLFRLEVKSPDGSNSQVAICLSWHSFSFIMLHSTVVVITVSMSLQLVNIVRCSQLSTALRSVRVCDLNFVYQQQHGTNISYFVPFNSHLLIIIA